MPTSPEQLMPVSLATFGHSSIVGIDLFVRPSPADPAVLLCSSADVEQLHAVHRLLGEGIRRVYIRLEDRNLYQRFLRDNWPELLSSELPQSERTEIMSEVIRDVLSEQFQSGSTDSIVDNCKRYGSVVSDLLGGEPIVVMDLVKVLHHDYGTFTHSTNVSAYAVLLAKALGYQADDLEQIAVGALLHDLGKLEISDDILNKPGKLSEEEFRIVQKHPTLGISRVADRMDLTYGQMMMIYQHHERCNGSGYPVACSGDDIHPWAKLCAIVDVFEALTSVRPYRNPLSLEIAISILDKGVDEFDKEMLQCWRSLMAS
jgi:putative nucleotidyltransferase with HDIG domain